MSAILPDIPNAPSGWNTDNHYFYEIVNRTGYNARINFVISSKNTTDDFRAICDRINTCYPVKKEKEEWEWRTHFRTATFEIDALSVEAIYPKLDAALAQILEFEAELREKLK